LFLDTIANRGNTMTSTASTAPLTAPLDRMRSGPGLWIGAAAIALVVTALAAWVTPDLARHGHDAFSVSGVFMSLSDLLLCLGVIALVRSDAVRPGGWRSVAKALAVAGSAASIGAEILLRISWTGGNDAFGVAGPAQALGFIGLGVALILDRRWQGPARFALLALGLYVPAVLVPALAASGGTNLAALAGFHTLVLVTGIAWLNQEK
jgi:hypothetical protein